MYRLLATALLAALALPVSAQDAPTAPPVVKPHLLERFKALAGEWSGAGLDGNSMPDTNVSYTITAGGNAVEELLFPGTSHEMRTLYVRDGDDVVLVHFAKAGHMHDASFTFHGPDELTTRWQFWDAGKPSEHVAKLHLKRVVIEPLELVDPPR
jgi:hypothetical protein